MLFAPVLNRLCPLLDNRHMLRIGHALFFASTHGPDASIQMIRQPAGELVIEHIEPGRRLQAFMAQGELRRPQAVSLNL